MQAHDFDITGESLDSVNYSHFCKTTLFSEPEREIVSKEKVLKRLPVGWIERRDFEVKHQRNTAQVYIFRPSRKFRQGIVGCSEKTNLLKWETKLQRPMH